MKHRRLLLFCLFTLLISCEENSPTIEPLWLENDFCPYIRLIDTYCSGRDWQSDEQWKQVIEDMLAEQNVKAIEINVKYKKPVHGFSECPCGAISGHYADVLVNEQDKAKLLEMGFKDCQVSN